MNAAAALKVDVCHQRGNGSYELVAINEHAYLSHQAHGDFPRLDGAWSGTFFDTGFPAGYPIEVSFDYSCSAQGFVIASVAYPGSCSGGTWRLQSNFQVLEEELNTPCLNGAIYQLSYNANIDQIGLVYLSGLPQPAYQAYATLLRAP
jgi:hypothetical protein